MAEGRREELRRYARRVGNRWPLELERKVEQLPAVLMAVQEGIDVLEHP